MSCYVLDETESRSGWHIVVTPMSGEDQCRIECRHEDPAHPRYNTAWEYRGIMFIGRHNPFARMLTAAGEIKLASDIYRLLNDLKRDQP